MRINISGDAFDFFSRKRTRQRDFAIDRAVFRFAHEMARDMRRKAPKAHSHLVNSIKPDKVDMSHYQVGPHVNYAADIEYGTRPGKWVSKQGIKDWLRVKGLARGNNLKSAVFLVRRKIHQKGTDAQPFVAPFASDRQWRTRLYDAISASLNSELR